MVRLNQDIKNKIFEDFKKDLTVKDIMTNYNLSRATVFRLKKEFNNIQYESNNETENNDKETEDNNNEISNNETEEEINEDDKETENNFNIEQFKKDLNNTIENIDNEDNETVKNNISLISNTNSVISKKSIKSVQFRKKREIIKPEIINDKNSILDTIKNVNVANDINELKEIRSTIIIIKQYINTFEKDLKNVYGNNRYVFEKKLFTLSLIQLKTILEDIRITINLKTNKSSFLTISQMAIKGIETVSNYSGYDVSGLENELMNDPDFLLDLQIISCELDLSKYLNPKSSCFLKLVRKMYVLNAKNKMNKTINDINTNPNLLEKIKNLELKK